VAFNPVRKLCVKSQCLPIMHLCRHGLPENDEPDIDGHGLSERMNIAATFSYIIFDASMRINQLRSDWTAAKISVTDKKGKKSELLNYRPVSLTSIVIIIILFAQIQSIKTAVNITI